MSKKSHALVGGGFGSGKPATTKERVAMAAGWHIADMIPDRAYTLMGRCLVQYWEVEVLGPQRLEWLRSLVRSLGTLSRARAIPPEVGAEIAYASLALLDLRGHDLPSDAHEVIELWLGEGDESELRHLLNPCNGLGDPSHKPTPPRPVCRQCGAAQ